MTELGCTIKENIIYEWTISNRDLQDKLYPLLYDNKENAGQITIDINNKKSINNITIVSGNKDSVVAPMSLVNYHTHPISCYLSEQCVIGYPSGEDIRESILFGLSGCITHVVPAVEGTYVCQVNPCILDNLINLDKLINVTKIKTHKLFNKLNITTDIQVINFFRGLIILCIEVYFRASHAFRDINFHIFCEKKYNKIMSVDNYIKYINNFTFNCIFNNKIKCTDKKYSDSLLKNNKIWVFDDNKYKQLDFIKYVDLYESDENDFKYASVYSCDKHGNILDLNIKLYDVLFKNKSIVNILKNIIFGSQCKYNHKLEFATTKQIILENSKLQQPRWFLMKLYKNKVNTNFSNIPVFYDNLTSLQKLNFLQYAVKNPHQKLIVLSENPIFYFFDLIGSCDHKHIKQNLLKSDEHSLKENKNHKRSFSKKLIHKLIMYGSPNCSYCITLKKKLEHKKIPFILHEYQDISEAVKKAKQIDPSINTIPALFKNINNKLIKIDHKIYYV